MVCEPWHATLDTYIDGEIPPDEIRMFEAHVRGCTSCSAEVLARVQMKRATQAAGRRYVPSAEFRRKMQQKITAKQRRSFGLGWMFAAVAAAVVVVGTFSSVYLGTRSVRDQIFSEIADLHVATLASSSPVDVISTDRHTVKPWFQGKLPFAFNLPELQNTQFSLLGGRMTYLEQTPGAHLIYDAGKHHISVFVFQERFLPAEFGENSGPPKHLPLNMETWTQDGLRYFVVGDASAANIDGLAKLFKAAS